MLGKSDSQLDFEDSIEWRERIPRGSFWWRFKLWADENIRDEDFADLFKEGGRPSVSPAKVVRGILVAVGEGVLGQGTRGRERVRRPGETGPGDEEGRRPS